MPLFACRRWKGIATPREGQILAWVQPNALTRLPDAPRRPAPDPDFARLALGCDLFVTRAAICLKFARFVNLSATNSPYNFSDIVDRGLAMLRTITIGSCVSVQGLFVAQGPDGKITVGSDKTRSPANRCRRPARTDAAHPALISPLRSLRDVPAGWGQARRMTARE